MAVIKAEIVFEIPDEVFDGLNSENNDVWLSAFLQAQKILSINANELRTCKSKEEVAKETCFSRLTLVNTDNTFLGSWGEIR